MLCTSNPAASREVEMASTVRDVGCRRTRECDTIEWEIKSGGGWRALRDSCMLSTHDGQCRFDMNMVVVAVSGNGTRNLGVGIRDWVGAILKR